MSNEFPTTGAIMSPQFLSNYNGKNVFNYLERELSNCNEFFISVAFITKSGITPFLQTLKELEEKNVKGRILTTDYLSFSEPEALDVLNQLKNIDLRMFETNNQHRQGFHTKGYIFKNGEKYNVIIGSSNLTQSALFRNYEWNVKCSTEEDCTYFNNVRDEFNALCNDSTQYKLCRDKYRKAYENNTRVRDEVRSAIKNLSPVDATQITPNEMQKCFISRLNQLVSKGEKRALLISATGTGKTYASALAIKDILSKKKGGRVLFISHREQINIQAKHSFINVFGNSYKMGLLSGSSNDVNKAKEQDFLFSTVQTMSKESYCYQFPKDYYSIIVLDECHRVGADSYQSIINYFTPDLWLGMSASPERSDDFDVFKTFEYNIAYEIRLQQALENNLLCPFHYFGITDFEVENENRDLKDFNRLVSEERVDYIISKAKYYGHSGKNLKGLVFCSTKEEAKCLSSKFNDKGYRTVALSGDDSQENRLKAIERLESDDEHNRLDYIFTVDIFNEGVDIPQINQILLLRPTQSPIIFVQQVGRGLRKHEDKEYVVILDFIGNYTNNYMIPIALSGDRSGNKDNMRRCLLEANNMISGASTIHFDAISRERIYSSIDTATMNAPKQLKNEYLTLRQKLGRIPELADFDMYGELDPLRIINRFGSYHNFLCKYEDEYRVKLNKIQNEMVDFISEKLAAGKRLQELLLLNILLNDDCINPLSKWKKELKSTFLINTDRTAVMSVTNVLSNVFYGIGSTKEKYKNCLFVNSDGTMHECFREQLQKSHDFKIMLQKLVQFGLDRNENNYQKSGSFVLYKKYTYDDVCRLLNWKTNVVANSIGGYFYDETTNTFPVFINYNKADDISESINYEDRFIDKETIIALSKSKRTRESKDVQRIIHHEENRMKILLFLRKNKDDKESKEFYYLGTMQPTGKIIDIKMGNGDNAVEIEYKLDKPVEENLYEYFLMTK